MPHSMMKSTLVKPKPITISPRVNIWPTCPFCKSSLKDNSTTLRWCSDFPHFAFCHEDCHVAYHYQIAETWSESDGSGDTQEQEDGSGEFDSQEQSDGSGEWRRDSEETADDDEEGDDH